MVLVHVKHFVQFVNYRINDVFWHASETIFQLEDFGWPNDLVLVMWNFEHRDHFLCLFCVIGGRASSLKDKARFQTLFFFMHGNWERIVEDWLHKLVFENYGFNKSEYFWLQHYDDGISKPKAHDHWWLFVLLFIDSSLLTWETDW